MRKSGLNFIIYVAKKWKIGVQICQIFKKHRISRVSYFAMFLAMFLTFLLCNLRANFVRNPCAKIMIYIKYLHDGAHGVANIEQLLLSSCGQNVINHCGNVVDGHFMITMYVQNGYHLCQNLGKL